MNRIQHQRRSFYVVFLVDPTGNKTRVARTRRKSGIGLLNVLYGETVQALLKPMPGIETVTMCRGPDRIALSNGWELVFGGTI